MNSELVINFVLWVSLSILLPLLPFGLGILIAAMQQAEVSIYDLIDGIELLLISLGLVTATGIELYKAKIDWSARTLLYFFLRYVLTVLGTGNVILLTLIYVDSRVSDLRFVAETRYTFVFVAVVAISMSAVAMQLYFGYIRYRVAREGI